MDTTTKIIGYGLGKYILIPLVMAIGAGLWAFLKQQKDDLPKKYDQYKKDKIKNEYRKELEKEALIAKLKKEVRDEMEESTKNNIS